VGGAIGGASVALLLARAGAQVTLLERADSVRAVGAGIALAENGLAVLDVLGLSADLARNSSVVSGVRVVDARGRTLFAPVGGVKGQAPHLLMARRSDLYALLSAAVAAESRIEIHYGVSVESVDDDGTVHAASAGKPRTFRAALVVGADGVHSRVRTSGSFGARVQPSGISYVRGLAAEGLARGEEAWTRAGLFGSFPVPGGSYWYASLGSEASRRALAARDLPALRVAWANAYAPAEALLSSMASFDQLLVNDVVRVSCARFYDGARVLVGDAAHAMAPNLGQGANSALVDAAVLMAELRRAETLQQALAAYDARRRPKVEQVASTAARLGKLAELTHPLLRFVRDRVLMPLAGLSDGAAMTRAAWQEDPATLGALA
jgi:2-polyprenyl-6-methoxyphenol hydroxylase-like FAD-dependent oxidoreductase